MTLGRLDRAHVVMPESSRGPEASVASISRSNPGPVRPESPLLQRGALEPWMVDELREAERNIRHWRLEVERRLAGAGRMQCAS